MIETVRTSPSPVRRAVNPLRHRIVVTGLVLVLLQAAWLVFVVGGSFFKEDDFQLIVRVTDPEMGWDGLLEPVGGRFVPGVLAVVWAAAWLDVYGWGLVTAIVVTVQALASVAVLRMLVVAFGERKAILAPFALYLFWPLAVPSLAWWSAALPVAGLHLALAMAVSSYLLRVRRGRRAATGVVVWTLVGSCFSAAALLIPVLLLAVHAVFLLGGRGAVRRVLRGSPVLWTLYGTLTAALGAVHLAARIAGQDVTPPAPGDAAGFVVRLLGETTATALVGGPFQWYLPRPDHGLALPDPPVTVTAWIVIVVVVWASSRVRGVRGAAPPGGSSWDTCCCRRSFRPCCGRSERPGRSPGRRPAWWRTPPRWRRSVWRRRSSRWWGSGTGRAAGRWAGCSGSAGRCSSPRWSPPPCGRARRCAPGSTASPSATISPPPRENWRAPRPAPRSTTRRCPGSSCPAGSGTTG
nr:hypothetical protein GCM10020093_094460 [Planobispora longispora]